MFSLWIGFWEDTKKIGEQSELQSTKVKNSESEAIGMAQGACTLCFEVHMWLW